MKTTMEQFFDYLRNRYGDKGVPSNADYWLEMEKKQTEISDEEIWTKANEIGKITNSSIAAQYLYEGAKWYREQLKNK